MGRDASLGTPCTFALWCLPFSVRVRPFTYTMYHIYIICMYACVCALAYWENLKIIYGVFVSDLWSRIRSSNSAREDRSRLYIISPLILYVYNIIVAVVVVRAFDYSLCRVSVYYSPNNLTVPSFEKPNKNVYPCVLFYHIIICRKLVYTARRRPQSSALINLFLRRVLSLTIITVNSRVWNDEEIGRDVTVKYNNGLVVPVYKTGVGRDLVGGT
jgi:hypothetical protein